MSCHLKKIGHRGEITVWLVDGQKIRKKVDPEFTNFGQHFRFPFIPENEFWIDKEAVPDERRFFIDHLITELKLMKKGLSYEEALNRADLVERSERQKAKKIKKLEDEGYSTKVENVRLRLLGKTSNGLSVWLVDGKLTRSLFFIDFTEGGHDLVYSFMPQSEVWLDNDLARQERPFILLHELYERWLMTKGLTYSQAHKKASRLEWQCRYSSEKLNKFLTKLGWQTG